MSNQFLTAKRIAQEALPILADHLVFPNLIYRDHSDDFAKQGDTIQVRRPNVFDAKSFTDGNEIALQDLNQFPVYVKMDQIADVSVQVSSAEMALSFDDFQRTILEPAILALAEKINEDGLRLAEQVPYWVGTAGQTPSELAPIAEAMRTMDVNKAPQSKRRAVWDPYANVNLLQLNALVDAGQSGSTATLRQSAMGRVYNFENYMSQGVGTHQAGSFASLNDVSAVVSVSNNAVDGATGFTYSVAQLSSDEGSSAGDLKKGDLLLIDGGQYVVIEDCGPAVAGVLDAKLYPAMKADVVDGVVEFVDEVSQAHVMNLAFHERAFAFVTRPLDPGRGVESYTAQAQGLTVRVSFGYDLTTKRQTMSIDTLYGFATLYPELACQILG